MQVYIYVLQKLQQSVYRKDAMSTFVFLSKQMWLYVLCTSWACAPNQPLDRFLSRKKADLSRRQQRFHRCSTRIAVEWARDRVNIRAVYCTIISSGACVCVIGGMTILLGGPKNCSLLEAPVWTCFAHKQEYESEIFVPFDITNTLKLTHFFNC